MIRIRPRMSLTVLAVLAVAVFGLTTGTARAGTGAIEVTVCSPSLSGGAFPYTNTTGTPPPNCGNSFAWGYTVSGDATGQATWVGPDLGPGYSCSALAWIPDSASNDPHAQYYVFTGSHYVANDAFVDQSIVTNGWTNVTNDTAFQLTNGPLTITLNDHNPFGESGMYEAAYAMLFICTQN